MENYQVLRKIGSGNFAKVYLAVHTPTGRRVSATRRAAPACELVAATTSQLCFGEVLTLFLFSVPQVALKVIEKRAVSSNKKLYLRVRREISNLKKIRHGNVVEIYESTCSHNTWPARPNTQNG